MMAGMVEETLEQKLKRHEDALSLCIAEIEKLRAENEKLRSEEGAHDVLRRLYWMRHRIQIPGFAPHRPL